MSEYIVTLSTFHEFLKDVQSELEKSPVLKIKIENGDIGKWGMARLWRAWMNSTSQWMAGKGAIMPTLIRSDGTWVGKRPYNENDAHEFFTSQWLGHDQDGNRLSWSKKGRDGMRSATKSERYHAMMKHEIWCLERGIALFKPIGSELHELKIHEID